MNNDNSNGCDSTAYLELTIGPPNSTLTIENACNNYTWEGVTYNTSGLYFNTLTNIYGCDSIAVLDLTIHQPVYNSYNVTACGSYLWLVNGNTYTSSGTYIYSNFNSVTNCTDIDTLNLIINNISFNGTSKYSCQIFCKEVWWVS